MVPATHRLSVQHGTITGPGTERQVRGNLIFTQPSPQYKSIDGKPFFKFRQALRFKSATAAHSSIQDQDIHWKYYYTPDFRPWKIQDYGYTCTAAEAASLPDIVHPGAKGSLGKFVCRTADGKSAGSIEMAYAARLAAGDNLDLQIKQRVSIQDLARAPDTIFVYRISPDHKMSLRHIVAIYKLPDHRTLKLVAN